MPSDSVAGNLLDRRSFLAASALASSSLLLSRPAVAATPAKPDTLNIALVGAGGQGRVLLENSLRIPGIRIRAVCDIWEYSRVYAKRYLQKYGHVVSVYENYLEMLEEQKDLDAVLVASPDWMHAEHSNTYLRAGHHVYCETPMSTDLEAARAMVRTAQAAGRLLQIGHQRRSNLRYIHAIDTLVKDAGLLGRVTHGNAYWNRSIQQPLGYPHKYEMPDIKLEEYGYESMHHFRNWQWYNKYGRGPLASLGTQQIDVFNWVFGPPSAVLASGGTDYYFDYENPDNVTAIFEYATPNGTARATYRVLSTSSRGRFTEEIVGTDGSLGISEAPNYGNSVQRESNAPDWEPYSKKGWLEKTNEMMEDAGSSGYAVDVQGSKRGQTSIWPLPVLLNKPAHQPHLENFFDAIRTGTHLNCPAETAYQTAVVVAKVFDALEAGRKLRIESNEYAA